MSLQTVTAIIANDAPGIKAYFAWSSTTKLRSLLIDYLSCPKDTPMVGKWVEVALDGRDRSRKPVKIVTDLFETRVRNGLAEIRVDFEHDGRFEDKFEMFYNHYFGYICDPKCVIPRVDQKERYNGWIVRHKENDVNSRWRLSIRQEVSKPQIKEKKLEDSTQCYNVVRAVVRSYARSGGSYFAWSTSRPKSTIRIDFDFCSPHAELLGRWVEVEIDVKNRTQKPVSIVDNLFETRIRGRAIEIFVDFQQISDSNQRSNNQDEIFYNEYFGCIRDEMCVIDNVERNGLYRGWIEYHQVDEISARWRVCMNQVVVGPLHESESNRFPSPARNERNKILSQYSNDDSHDSTRSCEQDLADSYSSEVKRRSWQTSPGISNNEDERLPTVSPEQPNFHHDKKYRRSPSSPLDMQLGSNKFEESSRPARAKQTDREQNSFYIGELPQKVNKTPAATYSFPKKEAHEKKYHGSSTTITPSNQATVEQRPVEPEKTSQKEQLLELRMKLDRISDIFAFFNANDSIRQSLRRMDIEQYDELVELTNANG